MNETQWVFDEMNLRIDSYKEPDIDLMEAEVVQISDKFINEINKLNEKLIDLERETREMIELLNKYNK